MIGWDGAPAWATLTDNTAPCQVSGRDLAPNVSRAFQSFYLDRDDIQTSLIDVWHALAAEFVDDPNVAEVDARVRSVMQNALDRLASKRRFPFLG